MFLKREDTDFSDKIEENKARSRDIIQPLSCAYIFKARLEGHANVPVDVVVALT